MVVTKLFQPVYPPLAKSSASMRRRCTRVRASVFLIGKAVSRKGRSCPWLTQRMGGLFEGVAICQQPHVAKRGTDEGDADGKTSGRNPGRNRQFGPTSQAGEPVAIVTIQPA